jgi:hypothetical protein
MKKPFMLALPTTSKKDFIITTIQNLLRITPKSEGLCNSNILKVLKQKARG